MTTTRRQNRKPATPPATLPGIAPPSTTDDEIDDGEMLTKEERESLARIGTEADAKSEAPVIREVAQPLKLDGTYTPTGDPEADYVKNACRQLAHDAAAALIARTGELAAPVAVELLRNARQLATLARIVSPTTLEEIARQLEAEEKLCVLDFQQTSDDQAEA